MIAMFAALTLAFAGQSADPSPGLGTPVSQDAVKDDQKKICQRYAPVTGSRIRRTKKVCLTADEWAELKRFSDDSARDLQRGQLNPDIGKGVGGG